MSNEDVTPSVEDNAAALAASGTADNPAHTRRTDDTDGPTGGSGLAGASGTPADYRVSSDGPEADERTGDTNITDDDLAAGDAPIAGEQGEGRPTAGIDDAGVDGSGGDTGINAPSSTSSVVSGDSTMAGGDTGLTGRDTDHALMEQARKQAANQPEQ